MQPTINLLNPTEIAYIDQESRRILFELGVFVDKKEALEVFRDAGAVVDFQKSIVKIPSELIDTAINKCSPLVKLYGRENRKPMFVGGENTYYGTTGFPTHLLDHETQTYRRCMYRDLVTAIRLADVLDQPDYILPNIGATDVLPEHVDLYEFKAALTNTTKHIQAQAQSKKNLKKIIAMAEIVAGGAKALRDEPLFSILVTLTSPLNLRPDAAELIINGAIEGLPLFIESGPMAGATSPATMAMTIITANAELLSSIVLAKQVNPDVPIIYATWARTMDMKTGSVCVGAPEFGMLRVATTQMAKYYHLPSGGGGTLTDARWIDVQMGAELLSTTLLPALCGTNLIQGMGLLGSMNAASLETMMISNEIIKYVQRIKSGIRVSKAASDINVFKEVGPLGNFLSTQHTLDNFRKEMWIPLIFERSTITDGETESKNLMKIKIKKRIREALDAHRSMALPKNIDRQLDEIINR